MILLKTILTIFIVSFVNSIVTSLTKSFFNLFSKKDKIGQFQISLPEFSISKSDLSPLEVSFTETIEREFSLDGNMVLSEDRAITYARYAWRDFQLNVGRLHFISEFEEDEAGDDNLFEWSLSGERYFICSSDGSISEVGYSVREDIFNSRKISKLGMSIIDMLDQLDSTSRQSVECIIKQSLNFAGYSKCDGFGRRIQLENTPELAHIEYVFHTNL